MSDPYAVHPLKCVSDASATNVPKRNLQQLSALLVDANGQASKAILPLEQWHPSDCGEMDLCIKANGEWLHEGSKMTRQSLVDLFATVLWREDDDYFLKTPVEKIKIKVEDVPLLVINLEQITRAEQPSQSWIRATTKTGDVVLVDEAHPVFLKSFQGELRPYIRIRRNLDALIHRNAFYHLLQWGELVEDSNGTHIQLSSGDQTFVLHAANF